MKCDKTFMQKLGSGAAAAAIAGSLTLGMGLNAAAPAEANPLLLLLPILGGTAIAGTEITIGGILGAGAITFGTVGISMAATQPGSFDWLGNIGNVLGDWFGHDKDANGVNKDTVKQAPYVPAPSREGTADPLFNGYVWKDTALSVTGVTTGVASDRSEVRFAWSTSLVDGGFTYGMVWATGTCRHPTDASVPPVSTSTGKIVRGGSVYPNGGDLYRHSTLSVTCGDLAIGGLDWIPVEVSVSPPTTAQKQTYMQPSDSVYTATRWADGTTTYRAADYAAANPQYIAEVTCVSPEGVRTKISATTNITPAGTVNVPSCKAAGLGDVAEDLVVGFADGDKLKQPIFTATPAHPDQFLNCDPALGQICKMEIYVDGVPCVVGSPACGSWAGLFKVNPSRVECRYGGAVVDMSACAVLEGAYIRGGTPSVQENTDGNPDTWKVPGTVPGWQPHIETPAGPAPDPNPGPVTNPNPNPAPDISNTPGTDPGTTPGTDPGTTPGTSTMPLNGTNPSTVPGTSGQNCLAEGWSWNPVSWVMVPVQCALQWAFVPPKTSIEADVNYLRPRLEARGIQPFITPFMTNFAALGGSGCQGPAISLAALHVNKTIYPFDACTAPLQGIASGVNAFFSLAIVIQGGMSCIRGAASAFGFNWGLGGKGDAE